MQTAGIPEVLDRVLGVPADGRAPLGWAWVWRPEADRGSIFPEEARLVPESAVESRRSQFKMGRMAAARAMRNLGTPPGPVLKGRHEEPLWPSGLVGSISHSGMAAVSLVGDGREYLGIGVDIEEIREDINPCLFTQVCDSEELAWVKSGECPARRFLMLFSAKESVFKAFFRQAGAYFWFREVELRWDEAAQAFAGTFAGEAARTLGEFSGFTVPCLLSDDFVFTYLVLRIS